VFTTRFSTTIKVKEFMLLTDTQRLLEKCKKKEVSLCLRTLLAVIRDMCVLGIG